MNSTGPRLASLLFSWAVLIACVSWAVPETTRGATETRAASSVSDHARPILVVQAPVVAEGGLPSRFPQGSHLALLEPGTQTPTNLTPEFFASADPAISFDGNQVLFAALDRSEGRWQVWEMKVDGSAKRQLTHCAGDCLRPAYLPKGHFVFTAVESDGSSQIHFADLDGTENHPITFGPGNYQVETVLKDGRILVTADSPLTPRKAGRTLYTLRHDGTSLQSLRCDHGQAVERGEASEMPDGSVVFVKSKPGHPGGELAMIRRGEPSNSTLGQFSAGTRSPRPLEPNKLLVARQAVMEGGAVSRFDLYAVNSSTGRGGELIFRDTRLSSVQAAPVAAHEVPRWYWSTVNSKAKSGYFICLDAYHSADAPQGRISTPISKVRALTLDPATRAERVLGEAPVETDGSFYIAVPPDQPIRFELLDEKNVVIRAQQSWIWSRRGEERGCVGCHEDKAVAPENRWPLTLRRFDSPTPLGTVVDVKVEE